MINKKKIILIVSLAVFLLTAGSLYYFYFHRNKQGIETAVVAPITGTSTTTTTASQTQKNPSCLTDDEIVEYTIGAKDAKKGTSSVDIILKDKQSGKEIRRFTIDSVWPVYFPVQLRKCNVYVIKDFNFDYKKFKPLPGSRTELWRYQYNGRGMPILTFAAEDGKGQVVVYYDAEFQVDFLEVYLALIKGYLGQIDFATLIKEIETKRDVFSLKYEDIVSKHPNLAGNFYLNEWSKDGRYFWGSLTDADLVLAFFRIERDTWKVDIFSAPDRTMGGDVLNADKGLITYREGAAPWSGDAAIDQQYREEALKNGRITSFYIYNLLTKQKILVATTTDPTYNFNQNWISDTELQYTLPNGEKKVYKID